jgi:phi LC3 family holin
MIEFFRKRHNGTFYVTAISQLIVVIQLLLAIFGYDQVITDLLKIKVLSFVDGVIVLLGMFGVINDPTVPSIKDDTKLINQEEVK